MKIHEYQAKEILNRFGIPVPRGQVAASPEEVREAFARLGGSLAVIKAQVHAGGRGKGGGIRQVAGPQEAYDAAREMLSTPLRTPQTGPRGVQVRRVLVEEAVEIARELYWGMVVDRGRACPVILASTEGGVDIEETARKSPHQIIREPIHPLGGMEAFQGRRLAFQLGLGGSQALEAADIFLKLSRVFHQLDASLVETNPLVVTREGRIIALDAKINLDDNALFRHPELAALRDAGEEDPLEGEARENGLSYIKLEGDIGCLVNGAGLAMATMDLIQLAGARPANFLDVGGGASTEQIKNAFRLLTADRGVKVILINIVGGILRCDRLARGVVEAIRETGWSKPVIIRLEGTNAAEGHAILEEAGLNLTIASGLKEVTARLIQALQ